MKQLGRLLVGVLLLSLAVPAFGAAVIDFGTGGAGVGGTYTLIGGDATGLNIPIGRVTIANAPTDNGAWDVSGACGGYACLSFSTVAGNNYITIVGYITSLGITTSETLLTGTLSSWTANANGLTNAAGPDTKAENLLTTIGLASTQTFALFGFSLATDGVNSDGVGTIISTDIRNTATPEPASLALMGFGLVGLGLWRRKHA